MIALHPLFSRQFWQALLSRLLIWSLDVLVSTSRGHGLWLSELGLMAAAVEAALAGDFTGRSASYRAGGATA